MQNTSPDQVLREQLLQLLQGGNAHTTLANAAAAFPPERMNDRPDDFPYTPWQLLEHIRIAQRDILDFIRDPDYEWLPWPEGYWPGPDDLADPLQWENTLRAIQADREELEGLLQDPATDLYADLPHAQGYNILRELLVVADHNAYHTGEFGILLQIVNPAPADSDA